MEKEIEIKLKSQEELATTIFELKIEKFKSNEQLQQYKKQIDELNNSLEKINKIVDQYGVQTIPSGLGECTIEMPVYEANIIYNLSKLKERNVR